MVDEKKEVSISEEVKELGYYDARALADAQESYGDSWKKRGGVGAFMMLARKWDRIENQTKKFSYNIFDAIHSNPSPTGILDDIGDLRRYLFLVEAEIRRELGEFPLSIPRGVAEANGKPSDPTALGGSSKGNRLGFTEGS
tara:strand:- start:555 stop:977 length:423 start_codon:yes stop_codon:yes gene_type:complete